MLTVNAVQGVGGIPSLDYIGIKGQCTANIADCKGKQPFTVPTMFFVVVVFSRRG